MYKQLFMIVLGIFLVGLVSATIITPLSPSDISEGVGPFVLYRGYNESFIDTTGIQCFVNITNNTHACEISGGAISITPVKGWYSSNAFVINCNDWLTGGILNVTTNCTGDGSLEYTDFEFSRTLLETTNLTQEIGLNYYTQHKMSMNFTSKTEKYIYKEAFIMDDFGTFANNPIIKDVDNDGVKEVLFAEYSGKLRVWNWTGLKTGHREATDNDDKGTYSLGTFSDPWATGRNLNDSDDFCIDNNANGFCEMVYSDYNGYMGVLEYNGSSVNDVFREPSDRGTYMQSPIFCDIDSDGDYDFFGCEYGGICRLYIWNSTDEYELNYTTSDLGTFHYSSVPTCSDIRNNDRNFLMTHDYNGVPRLWNWTGNTLDNIWTGTDRGNMWVGGYNDKFLYTSPDNFYIIPFSNGISYAYNCSTTVSTGCVEMDSSTDAGTYNYGSATGQVKNIGNGRYLMLQDSTGEIHTLYLSSSTTLSLGTGPKIYGDTLSRIGLPQTNNLDYPEYILQSNRYNGDISVSTIQGQDYWIMKYLVSEAINEHYDRSYFYGFLYMDGWTCEDLAETDFDGDGDHDDVCIISTYDGLPFIYTLQKQNIWQVGIKTPGAKDGFSINPQLGFSSQTGVNSIAYRPDGENRTYFTNQEINLLEGCAYSGCNCIDDDGTIISCTYMTDGQISSGIKSNDATDNNWDNSASITDKAWFQMNISYDVMLGSIGIWNEFTSEMDPLDFEVNISNSSCDADEHWTNIFDEDEGNSNTDITGSGTSKGWKILFKPQIVKCIRVAQAGSRYSQTSWSGSYNSLVELQGYSGTDSWFVTAYDNQTANVFGLYNFTPSIYRDYGEADLELLTLTPKTQWTASTKTSVIDRMIIWIQRTF